MGTTRQPRVIRRLPRRADRVAECVARATLLVSFLAAFTLGAAVIQARSTSIEAGDELGQSSSDGDTSVFHIYRGYVVAIFAAQLALIVGLLIQRARRRRAEEEAQRNADRYRSVVETQSELVCRFLPDTTLTFVNDAYCRFWNKPREQLLGRKFIELIPEAARQTVLERIVTLETGVDSHEHAVTLPDGTVGWHHWVNCAILDSQGRRVELQGVGRDLSDRRRAEEALAQAEARNSAMLRAIPDLMFVLQRDGTYVDYHSRSETVLFVAPGQFIGRNVRDVLPAPLADTMLEALERASRGDEPAVLEYELAMDEPRFFEARIVKADGDRLLSIVRDVTESKRASQLNRDLARRLIVSQEAERQRIARELHDDVSQRIALLNIEIDQIAAQVDEGDARARLRKLSSLAGEVASELHHLSHDLHPSKLQAIGLVAAIRSLCRDASAQRDLHVAFTHGALPASVNADVSLCLYRLVQEGLHNIARHSHTRDAQVALTCDDGHVALSITDTGVGFDPTSVRHSGLGLVSMRERVAVLNGELMIHSAPGKGTRIDARIPLAAAAADNAPAFTESA
jgi:PAS domain S-box-containing protein